MEKPTNKRPGRPIGSKNKKRNIINDEKLTCINYPACQYMLDISVYGEQKVKKKMNKHEKSCNKGK